MNNILIKLPAEVELKIERDAQNECDKMTENLEEQESPIVHVIKQWVKLYKEEKRTKWFLEYKHKLKVTDIEESCQEIARVQEEIINELQTDIINLKRQVK